MWPPQEGTLSTHVIARTSVAEQMFHARMENKIVLLEGALVSSNAMDRLQDGIKRDLHARESCTIQVLREQENKHRTT